MTTGRLSTGARPTGVTRQGQRANGQARVPVSAPRHRVSLQVLLRSDKWADNTFFWANEEEQSGWSRQARRTVPGFSTPDEARGPFTWQTLDSFPQYLYGDADRDVAVEEAATVVLSVVDRVRRTLGEGVLVG